MGCSWQDSNGDHQQQQARIGNKGWKHQFSDVSGLISMIIWDEVNPMALELEIPNILPFERDHKETPHMPPHRTTITSTKPQHEIGMIAQVRLKNVLGHVKP